MEGGGKFCESHDIYHGILRFGIRFSFGGWGAKQRSEKKLFFVERRRSIRGVRCPFYPVSTVSETEQNENKTTNSPNTKKSTSIFLFSSTANNTLTDIAVTAEQATNVHSADNITFGLVVVQD